jgi:hypothetical protein
MLKFNSKILKWSLISSAIFILFSIVAIREFIEVSALKQKLAKITKRDSQLEEKIDELQSIIGCPNYPSRGTLNQKIDTLLLCFKGEETKEKTTSTKEETIPTYGVGQEFVIENTLKWIILEVRNRGNILPASERKAPYWQKGDVISEGKFIQVRMKVENVGKEEVSIWPPNEVYDDKGRKFESVGSGIISEYVPEDKFCMLIRLKPTFSSRECIEIYEVAKDSNELWLFIPPVHYGNKGAFVYLGKFE